MNAGNTRHVRSQLLPATRCEFTCILGISNHMGRNVTTSHITSMSNVLAPFSEVSEHMKTDATCKILALSTE